MSDKQANPEHSERQPRGLTEIIQHDVAHNREFIPLPAAQLKTRHGVLYEIEKRYLRKLIEAERAYEEELRALFPHL